MSIPSYPSPKHLGDRHITDLLRGSVVVQEKVDGSQISFGVDYEGTLRIRSRGGPIAHNTSDKLFAPACAAIVAVKDRLPTGYVFRGEAVTRPRHNALLYGRVPAGFVALFDAHNADGHYADPAVLADLGRDLGFDVVPTYHVGELRDLAAIDEWLGRQSFLGGCKIEGVVIKNYALAHAGAEHFAGKVVSAAFKEIRGEGQPNTKAADGPQALADLYRTEARWQKAVQHLREAGELTDTPADIGKLVKEVQADIETECGEEIRNALYALYRKQFASTFVKGLPEWYKGKLLEAVKETLTDS